MSGILFKPDEGDRFTVSGNWSSYDGESALAIGGLYRVGDDFFLSGGVGVGLDEGKVGGPAGFLTQR